MLAASLWLTTPAFAQQPPPTDQEVAAAKKEFCGDDRRVGIGSHSNRPPDAGQYKPEWKARCEAIDAEHEKRGLAAKAKQADDQKRLDSIIGRIK